MFYSVKEICWRINMNTYSLKFFSFFLTKGRYCFTAVVPETVHLFMLQVYYLTYGQHRGQKRRVWAKSPCRVGSLSGIYTLGIRPYSIFIAKSAEEHKQFTIEKTPKGNVWFCDTEDLGTSGYGLCMSAEDMAKIGQLCLNKGVYNGKRIISSSWIEEMTRPRIIENQNWQGMEYGYLWWILDREKNIYAALGNSGNVIYIDPEKNIVIYHTFRKLSICENEIRSQRSFSVSDRRHSVQITMFYLVFKRRDNTVLAFQKVRTCQVLA